jgi:hypothetical protein
MSQITRTIDDGVAKKQWGPAISIQSKEEGIEIIKRDIMNLFQMNSNNSKFTLDYQTTKASYTFWLAGYKRVITWDVK